MQAPPHTAAGLARDLAALGVRPGGVLLVQASLRSVGPVAGGAAAVVAALRTALGPGGTLVGYTATPENSTTSPLHRERVRGMDEAGLAAHLAAMPPFDPAATPASPTMGRLAEQIRTTPGALRSRHPQTSFAAVGPAAADLVRRHPLESHLGEESPLGALYRAGGQALVVGPIERCTVYHLADYRTGRFPPREYACVVRGADGGREWRRFAAPALDDGHLAALDREVRRLVRVPVGTLGSAPCRLLPVREAVDAAVAVQRRAGV
ncbi:AAC(3) family N-acetyltransferase [Streptacidiphilus sp. ASG 303]|uniref:aminoglycoside N(3)-acetyltransferase n=1 Tax=Streptacidiphilus sp. ASG 303 TaxID=2896847 RepID=UPI001E3BB210|nr:AAC(3) family N-acetyltransferase [Streptacidiphilus sp. ASG 303]MCD0482111.1 AAC(3) family N-acetyltransferase [Streptacidiphilus sp. ASG 303]